MSIADEATKQAIRRIRSGMTTQQREDAAKEMNAILTTSHAMITSEPEFNGSNHNRERVCFYCKQYYKDKRINRLLTPVPDVRAIFQAAFDELFSLDCNETIARPKKHYISLTFYQRVMRALIEPVDCMIARGVQLQKVQRCMRFDDDGRPAKMWSVVVDKPVKTLNLERGIIVGDVMTNVIGIPLINQPAVRKPKPTVLFQNVEVTVKELQAVLRVDQRTAYRYFNKLKELQGG